MRLKGLGLFLTAVISACLLVIPGDISASAYDGTHINADLNASRKPDHITLTWLEDPATTMTIPGERTLLLKAVLLSTFRWKVILTKCR